MRNSPKECFTFSKDSIKKVEGSAMINGHTDGARMISTEKFGLVIIGGRERTGSYFFFQTRPKTVLTFNKFHRCCISIK